MTRSVRGLVLLAGGWAASAALAFPTIALTEAELQRRVVERFPVTRALPLGAELTLSNPVVSLADTSGRLRMLTDAVVSVPGARPLTGQADVSGSVRFDREQGRFLLDEPRLEALQVPGLPQGYAGLARQAANAAVSAAVQSLTLHTLTDEDFAQRYARRFLKSVRVENRKLLLEFD